MRGNSWLVPLLLVSATASVSASSTCQEKLILADANPKDWHLNYGEYAAFANLEAQQTPLLLEQGIIQQATLPPSLDAIYQELVDDETLGINIRGVDPTLDRSSKDARQLLAIVTVLCGKTRQAMAKLLDHALTAADQQASNMALAGPFVGESLSKGLHKGNKVPAIEVIDWRQGVEADPEVTPRPESQAGTLGPTAQVFTQQSGETFAPAPAPGDDGNGVGDPQDGSGGGPPAGNPCAEQDVMLTTCIAQNDCDACADLISNQPGVSEPDYSQAVDASGEPEYNLFVGILNDFLAEQCTSTQQEVCTLKGCCPSCDAELNSIYQCFLEAAVGEFQAVLDESDIELGDPMATPLALMMECDLAITDCGTVETIPPGPTDGNGNGKPDGVDGGPPPDSFAFCVEPEVALDRCVKENSCDACGDLVMGDGPVEPDFAQAMDETGLPNYNAVIELMNGFLTEQCTYTQGEVCALKSCCPACSVELDGLYKCLLTGSEENLQGILEEVQATLAGLNGGENSTEIPLELMSGCDVAGTECAANSSSQPTDQATGRYQFSYGSSLDPLKFNYDVDTESGTLAGQVVYDGLGWVAFAVSGGSGEMVGSHAIIGTINDDNPDDSSVQRYILGGYSVDSVTLSDTPVEGLEGEIVQNATHTIMTFVVSLENPNDSLYSIDPSGLNTFLLAAGSSNTLAFHVVRDSFEADLGTGVATGAGDSPDDSMESGSDESGSDDVESPDDSTESESQEDADGETQGGFSFDKCPEQQLAYTTCLGANNCASCEYEIGEAPEEPNIYGEVGEELPSYNTVVETMNGFLAQACEFTIYSVCFLRDCCVACQAELDALYGCVNEPPLQELQAGIEETLLLLGASDFTPATEEALELVYNCDLTSIQCDAVLANPPSIGSEEGEGINGDEDQNGEGTVVMEPISIQIDTAFIVSSTEGITADDIKSDSSHSNTLSRGLEASLTEARFLELVEGVLQNSPPTNTSGPPGGGSGAGGVEGRPEGNNTAREGPQTRRRQSLLAIPITFGLSKISAVEDTDCPEEVNDGANCVIAFGFYIAESDGSIDTLRLKEALTLATDEWINDGGLQSVMPADSPFTVVESAPDKIQDASSGNGTGAIDEDASMEDQELMESRAKPVLVNSSFVMSSPGGKKADELKADLDGEVVRTLVAAYTNFVNLVATDLGAEKDEGGGPAQMRHLRESIVQNLSPTYRNLQAFSQRGRKLAITYDADSAEIYDFRDSPCEELSNATSAVSKQGSGADEKQCISVFGKYRVYAGPDDNVEEVYQTFVEATQMSISDGKLEEAVQATAAEQNLTIAFVIEGVSSVVDDSFDAFTEIETEEDSDSESGEGLSSSLSNATTTNPTSAPTSKSTNTASSPDSSSNNFHTLTLTSVMVGAISLVSIL